MSTFHLHLPLSVTCVGRSLYFLSDRDSSSTAECRLSLCMSQLLCQCQLHAGAAAIPQHNSPALKRNNKRKESLFCWFGRDMGQGRVWAFFMFMVCWGFFPILKRQSKLQVIKTSAKTRNLAHFDTKSEPI